MPREHRHDGSTMTWTDIVGSLFVASICGVLLHLITGRAPLDGPDEGYLWVNAQRTLAGRRPLADFRSYEPGRYWFMATMLRRNPRSLRALRLGETAASVCGFAVVCLALRGIGTGWVSVVLAALAASLWSVVPHKRFDQTATMLLFAGAVAVIFRPAPTSFLALGIAVGLSMVIGLNWAIYGTAVAGLLSISALLHESVSEPWWIMWLLIGAIIGSAPLWIYLTLVPRARVAFADLRFRRLVNTSRTKPHLPVPYPWRSIPERYQAYSGARQRVYAWIFVFVPLAGGAAVVSLFLLRDPGSAATTAVAGALVTFACWHHVLSRADQPHVAEVAIPLAAGGVAAIPSRGLGVLAQVALLGAMFWLLTPNLHRLHARYAPREYETHSTAGGAFTFTPGQWSLVRVIQPVVRERAEVGAFMAVPTLAWIYPVLRIDAPNYDIFPIHPATRSEQLRMIREIETEGVATVLVDVTALDNDDSLRFRATHPLVWDHLMATFELHELSPEFVFLFRSQEG